MSVTIRQKYDGLLAYLQAGVFNLTSDEVVLASKACLDLINAIPQVTLSFDQEDDRRTLLAQLRIIKRQLDQIKTPTFTAKVTVGPETTLYGLALDYLGDATRWNEIAELNGLNEPYLADITTLQLPVK